MKKRIKTAFTLTEVLLAVVIVGVISTLVMPSIVRHYQEKGFVQAEYRLQNTITSAIKGLAVTENKQNFAQTSMYLTEEPASYTDSSEAFIRNYLRAGKICGDNNGDCFAKTYYTYKDNDKKVYTPIYKGSCAKLRNGMSICITPQIGETAISVLVDLNGEKGPNVYGKDLREISLSSEEIASTDTTTGTVAWDWFLLDTGCKLSCGDDYTLDEANCECKCSKTCDSDYTLDEDSCSCSCSKACEDGYTLDEDTCSCVADSQDTDVGTEFTVKCTVDTDSASRSRTVNCTLSGSGAKLQITYCSESNSSTGSCSCTDDYTYTKTGTSIKFTQSYGCGYITPSYKVLATGVGTTLWSGTIDESFEVSHTCDVQAGTCLSD